MQHNNKIVNLTNHNISRYNFSVEIVGQHHRLTHKYEQTPGDSDVLSEIAWPDAVHREQRVRHDLVPENSNKAKLALDEYSALM